ncbi:MAG: phosphoglycerate dehydrogenase [Anaerostipes sp.]|uniref:phosphoglycerate dehydrogenase n=1 Tax=Anaerostipes sp. 992a TaxID=1261637 RepID=UPI000952D4D4|nr:phosphoglycerate dehydrogenase [Anaerostipes sp. 992a]MCI5951872.1 phosphoglycerate dehydrogenase [Anaerostipes sp.]MDD5969607.1 phosphoglycerate dehydrogenase [Anaerostipes sp.]OLR62095.1 3-phosphoglycerate dehydrogenase [Anaerostipes sp. 992a]
MYNVKCLNPIAQIGLDNFTDEFQMTEEINEAEAVLVRSASMHEIEAPEKLLAVARAGAGVNNIPLDDYAQKGVVVFNTPGANANGVKELVVAGLLLASRDIIGGVNWAKENADDENLAKTVEKQKKKYAGNELKGKSLGVIGLGAIGVLVANMGFRLGMKVYGYDPYLSVKSAWQLSSHVKVVQNIEEIYENCDYITLHLPLLDSTKGTINKESIAMMKDGVRIMNFARGGLVDDAAIIEALENGKVGKYVTDFPDSAVASAPNTIAIPHLGASTEESEDNCAIMAVEQIVDYIKNGNITNSVNYPNCDMGVCQGAARMTICHKNRPNMLGHFTTLIAAAGMNIVNLTNKSKGQYAYTILDLESVPVPELVETMKKVRDVLKVRVL